MPLKQHFTYTNDDGLLIREGPKDVVEALPRSYDNGQTGIIIVDFTYDNIPQLDQDAGGGTTEDSLSSMGAYLPARSIVTRAFGYCKTAFDSTETLNVGFYKADGSALDEDGIFAALDVDAVTAFDTAGNVVVADGVMPMNSTNFDLDACTLASDGYLVAGWSVGADIGTQGAARIFIEYVRGWV